MLIVTFSTGKGIAMAIVFENKYKKRKRDKKWQISEYSKCRND